MTSVKMDIISISLQAINTIVCLVVVSISSVKNVRALGVVIVLWAIVGLGKLV